MYTQCHVLQPYSFVQIQLLYVYIRGHNVTCTCINIVVHIHVYIMFNVPHSGSCADIMHSAQPFRNGFKQEVIAVIIRDVVQGLEYLHNLGYVHRYMYSVWCPWWNVHVQCTYYSDITYGTDLVQLSTYMYVDWLEDLPMMSDISLESSEDIYRGGCDFVRS